MRHARRLFAVVIGCAAWFVAAATSAYARPDPGGGVVIPVNPPPASAAGTPMWEFVATAALGVLLAVAVMGLVFSLRHSRSSEPSRRSEPSRPSQA
jgi:Na+/H+ antiporter NhaD/arsenite permease-like protein